MDAVVASLEWWGGYVEHPTGAAVAAIMDGYAAAHDGQPLLSTRSPHPAIGQSYFSSATTALFREGRIERNLNGKRLYMVRIVGADKADDYDDKAKAVAKITAARKAAPLGLWGKGQMTYPHGANDDQEASEAATLADKNHDKATKPAEAIAQPERPDLPPVEHGAGADVDVEPAAEAEAAEWPDLIATPDEADAIAVALLRQVVGVLSNPTRTGAETRLAEQLEVSERLRRRLRDTEEDLRSKGAECVALRERVRRLEANVQAVLKAPRVDDKTRRELELLMRAPGPSKAVAVV
jgi:hypothetical protein